MPTYEYTCKSCGQNTEAVQSFHDAPLTVCPNCGGELRKVFGAVGIAFKGSGFYKTDSRPRSKESSGSSSSSSESSGSSGSSESKTSSSESKSPSSESKSSSSSDKSSGSSDKSAGSSNGSSTKTSAGTKS